MQSIGSKFDLGFVLDLLHLDDHEFSRQVVTRLSRSQDRTSTALSSAQVKDLVLDNMVITQGARQTVEWLNTIAHMSFFMSFWLQFPQGPPLHFGFLVMTPLAEQWYEQSWSSVQLNLDEGTVLAFICRCSSDRPVIPSHSFSGENASQPEHSSHRHKEGSTRPLGLCP